MLWTRRSGSTAYLVQRRSSDTIFCAIRREYAMGWTDERVEQLKSLWNDGLSASQIARVLGSVTRNAVIGKVHRLGLAGRAGPARAERPRTALPRKPSVHAAPLPPVVEEDPITLSDGHFATVLTIND